HGLAYAARLSLPGPPGLGFLIEGATHAASPSQTQAAAGSNASAAMPSPSQARAAERTANTQTTAPAWIRKLPVMPSSTASEEAIGKASAATLDKAARP